MSYAKSKFYGRRRFLVSVGFVATGILWGIDTPVISAHDELPPRPSPIQDGETDGKSAAIQLWPTPIFPKLWTVVQWVDGQEKWHDVDGWRGTLNHPAYVSWRVLQSEFGKGPFRWVVYDEENGNVIAISELFHLPINNGEILKIKVALPKSNPSEN